MWAVTTSSIAHGALGGGRSLLQRAWFPNYSFLIFLLMWRLYSRALCEWENWVSVTDVHLHSVVVACRPHVEGMYIGYDGFWASRKACWYWRCCAAAPSKEKESGDLGRSFILGGVGGDLAVSGCLSCLSHGTAAADLLTIIFPLDGYQVWGTRACGKELHRVLPKWKCFDLCYECPSGSIATCNLFCIYQSKLCESTYKMTNWQC